MEVISIDLDNGNCGCIIALEDTKGFTVKYSWSKWAKFIINDLKSLEKEGNVFEVDNKKLMALFAISEDLQWFTRKDIIEFTRRLIKT